MQVVVLFKIKGELKANKFSKLHHETVFLGITMRILFCCTV